MIIQLELKNKHVTAANVGKISEQILDAVNNRLDRDTFTGDNRIIITDSAPTTGNAFEKLTSNEQAELKQLFASAPRDKYIKGMVNATGQAAPVQQCPSGLTASQRLAHKAAQAWKGK